MAIHKATLFFESGLYGWTESFWRDTNASLDNTLALATKLALKRAAISGYGVKITYIRSSDEAERGDSSISATPIWVVGASFAPPAELDPRTFYTVSPAEVAAADQPYSAVMVRMESVPSGGNPPISMKRRTMYLRGLPDVDIVNPPPFARVAKWNDAFDKWRSELTQWSFRATNRNIGAVTRNILGWSFSPLFVSLNILNHPYVTGDLLAIRGAKAANSGFRPNRYVRVAAIPDVNTIQVVSENGRPIRYLAGTEASGGTTALVTTATIYPLIAHVSITGETHRTTGRPFGSPVGRRRARP